MPAAPNPRRPILLIREKDDGRGGKVHDACANPRVLAQFRIDRERCFFTLPSRQHRKAFRSAMKRVEDQGGPSYRQELGCRMDCRVHTPAVHAPKVVPLSKHRTVSDDGQLRPVLHYKSKLVQDPDTGLVVFDHEDEVGCPHFRPDVEDPRRVSM